ncbi:hypothetical protein SOVF_041880 isoform B [Spinacia oleracea]|nr:hypothetical protein SOVF_041880 isoform B [Spinacia oleracea]
MARVSFNLVVVPAILAITFMLSTATVLGKVTTTSEEMEMPVGYKMMLEEMALARKVQSNMYDQPAAVRRSQAAMKGLMDVLVSSSSEKAMQCVAAGGYCNLVFGPRCCTNDWACVPPGLVGGVCVA